MVDHLLKGTPDGIINRVESELFGGMQVRFYAGAGGPGPQFVAGPQIFEGVPVFYHRHSVCDDMQRPRGQAP